MEEVYNVKERLKKFVSYTGLSEGKFEKKVGFSKGFVSQGRDSIRKSSYEKILNKYPELNLEWLLTGSGEMLKKVQSNDIGISNIIADNNSSNMLNVGNGVNIHANNIEKIIREIEKKTDDAIMPEIDKLQHIIESLKQEIAHLKSIIASKDSENGLLKGNVEDLRKTISAHEKTIEFFQNPSTKLNE